MKQNEFIKLMGVLLIYFLVIGGFGYFMYRVLKDAQRCEKGSMQEELTKDGKVYLECGTAEKRDEHKEVRGNRIETIMVIERGETHIEVLDTNWTDSDWVGPGVALAFAGATISTFVLFYVVLPLLFKKKKNEN